jgi:hypothetical protein
MGYDIKRPLSTEVEARIREGIAREVYSGEDVSQSKLLGENDSK